jgi:hypothetical protein
MADRIQDSGGGLAARPRADQLRSLHARAGVFLLQADAALMGESESRLAELGGWRQQLRGALPAAVTTSAVEPPESAAGPVPFGAAFARGNPVTWYVAPGADGPRLTWPEPTPTWPVKVLQTLVLTLLGLLGVWWSGRPVSGAWAEQLMLIGLAAWVAGAGMIWLVPAVAGIVGRTTLLIRAAARRWWPANEAVDRPSVNGAIPG